MNRKLYGVALAVAVAGATPGIAEISQMSAHVGSMAAGMEAEAAPAEEGGALNNLRFEPWQMVDEMFFRDDVVYLMRHGPTDWSKLDEKNVNPTDCDNQRVMIEDGINDMRRMGFVLGENGVMPGKIVVSEWCRNQQTVEALLEGYEAAEPGTAEGIPVETSADLNLLLSLQGAENVTALRDRISEWEGSDGQGPLLLVSHFTNIEELTQFTVYEGEILVIDPKRDNRVLGYVRLSSAEPDVGHFP
ncbi:MAG: hypothetical protein NXH97_20895 [Rhodobacteraceae bacterium]|nr:hypothetical protein [Paracoccaceae bacterium]